MRRKGNSPPALRLDAAVVGIFRMSLVTVKCSHAGAPSVRACLRVRFLHRIFPSSGGSLFERELEHAVAGRALRIKPWHCYCLPAGQLRAHCPRCSRRSCLHPTTILASAGVQLYAFPPQCCSEHNASLLSAHACRWRPPTTVARACSQGSPGSTSSGGVVLSRLPQQRRTYVSSCAAARRSTRAGCTATAAAHIRRRRTPRPSSDPVRRALPTRPAHDPTTTESSELSALAAGAR